MNLLREIAELVEAGRRIETLPGEFGGEIITDYDGDCWLPADSPIWCDDGNAPLQIDEDTSRAAAEQYVADGDWPEDASTWWCNVRTWREAIDRDGEIVEVLERWHK